MAQLGDFNHCARPVLIKAVDIRKFILRSQVGRVLAGAGHASEGEGILTAGHLLDR